MSRARKHMLSGLAYARDGEHARALSEFDRAVELEPGSVPALYNRGCMYARLGDARQAEVDFARALEIDPTCEKAKKKLEEMERTGTHDAPEPPRSDESDESKATAPVEETELLKLVLEDADASTRAEVLARFAAAEGTAEFCALSPSAETFASAVDSLERFKCDGGPITVWAQRGWADGAVQNGVIFCRAPVSPEEFTALTRCLAQGATTVRAEWLGINAAETPDKSAGETVPDSSRPSSKATVGKCEKCGRELRVKPSGIRKSMNLTCKCGASNTIEASDDLLGLVPQKKARPARNPVEARPAATAIETQTGSQAGPPAGGQQAWLRHGQSAQERVRGDLPSNVHVIVLDDPASTYRLYASIVSSLHPWNAQVFFPSGVGDFVAKVANDDAGEVVGQLRAGDYELDVEYHEYPSYPLLYMTLRTGTTKQTGKPHCVECLADFAEANFQDFVLGIQDDKKMNVHIFDESGRLHTTHPFQCKSQLCSDILNFTKRANAAAVNIPPTARSFEDAAVEFFREHAT